MPNFEFLKTEKLFKSTLSDSFAQSLFNAISATKLIIAQKLLRLQVLKYFRSVSKENSSELDFSQLSAGNLFTALKTAKKAHFTSELKLNCF